MTVRHWSWQKSCIGVEGFLLVRIQEKHPAHQWEADNNGQQLEQPLAAWTYTHKKKLKMLFGINGSSAISLLRQDHATYGNRSWICQRLHLRKFNFWRYGPFIRYVNTFSPLSTSMCCLLLRTAPRLLQYVNSKLCHFPVIFPDMTLFQGWAFPQSIRLLLLEDSTPKRYGMIFTYVALIPEITLLLETFWFHFYCLLKI